MMRRKKTHSLSYFRGEKKHSRKKRFDPYLPLYLKAIVRSSSREVPLEGRSERETEDDEFYFLATPSSLLPFLRRYGKKGERWLFFFNERERRRAIFHSSRFVFSGQHLPPHCSKILTTTQNVLVHTNAITDANDEKIEGTNRRHRQGGRQG